MNVFQTRPATFCRAAMLVKNEFWLCVRIVVGIIIFCEAPGGVRVPIYLELNVRIQPSVLARI